MTTTIPDSDVDIWADETILDPFPVYRALRDLGPVVHLTRHGFYAVTRYDDVKHVLNTWQDYSSAAGVSFSPTINGVIAGSLIASDPPDHQHYRKIMERPLTPAALKQVRDRINALSIEIVDTALAKGHVEAVAEIATRMPLALVAELVGLPPEGRDRMLGWAAGGFNALAPEGVDRVAEGLEQMGDMANYFNEPDLPDRLLPGSWGARLRDAARAGEISHEQFISMLQNNYVLAALDTTIHATSNLLWLLASHPETWAELRANRALIGRAVNEALRLEGPAQAFSRLTTRGTIIGGVIVPVGTWLMVSFAAANRDERHYANPDRFDIRRDAGDHLAFGYKEHVCLGRNLAMLEITSLLTVLVDRVERLELIDARRGINNSLRGFERLELALKAAA